MFFFLHHITIAFLCAHLEVPNEIEIEIFHSWNVLIELELNGLSINELRDFWMEFFEVVATSTGISVFKLGKLGVDRFQLIPLFLAKLMVNF